jgi:hypothetical protein
MIEGMRKTLDVLLMVVLLVAIVLACKLTVSADGNHSNSTRIVSLDTCTVVNVTDKRIFFMCSRERRVSNAGPAERVGVGNDVRPELYLQGQGGR